MTNTDIVAKLTDETTTSIPLQENATETVGVPPAGGPAKKGGKRKNKRRVAKGLAYLALLGTAVLILAEPWLLIPAIALLAAIALWD
ncbi:hypothetical protein ACIBI9_45320 [Nonomuraea sp. NPDC050451]|uniref:hypothetical protein n=1 Tax=Nonomuraea sp. NPDC050451 TaxID=3364364 RepID=UPI003797298B